MAIKELLVSNNVAITEIDQWQKRREDIASRLFSTIGTPPVPRNTRHIEIIQEEKQRNYTRRKIRYVVGDDDSIMAYLLIPNRLKPPAPAVVAMHQTVASGKDEVVGLEWLDRFLKRDT